MLAALNNALDFKGRANRREYWLFTVFTIILQVVAGLMAGIMHVIGSGIPAADIVAVLGGGLSLFLFIPSLSVTCRRLHDTNRTAWWVLLGLPAMLLNVVRLVLGLPLGQFLPFEGFAGLCALALLVFMILRGTPGRNRFDAADGSREGRLSRHGLMEGGESRRPAIDFSPEAAAILWPSQARTGGERPAFGKKP